MDKDKLKVVKSSLIQAYSYNPEDKTLNVVFKDGIQKTFVQVPPDVMSAVFDRAGSVGSKFHRLVKGKYQSHETE